MKHAKGLGQLIKIRGPDRYRNQLDITLLKASRGLVVRYLWQQNPSSPIFMTSYTNQIVGHAFNVLW
jgi:hypothetical protein